MIEGLNSRYREFYAKATAAELIFIAIYIDDILVLVKDKDAAIKKNEIAQDPDNNSILYTYQPNRQTYNFWGIRILVSLPTPPVDGQLLVILLFLTGLLYIQVSTTA